MHGSVGHGLAALAQGCQIDVTFALDKTGANADTYWYLYLGETLISSATTSDAAEGWTVIHAGIHILASGASANVYCHSDQVHETPPHVHLDDQEFTTVDLSAATSDLDLVIVNGSASDSVQAIGWQVEIRTPTS
jgi:hypothetical protein